MNEVKIFSYNGSNVTFQNGENVMINATEMAKSFGKLVGDWTRLKSTNDFLQELESDMHIPISQLIVVNKGNSANFEQGTWMYEDVALEFARWLSPAFAIWCNNRIKELLKYGMTATQPTLEQMIDNPDLIISLASKLKEERAERERLAIDNKEKQKLIEQQTPSVVFTQAVVGSQSSCLIGELAKMIAQHGIKIGEHRLFKWLRKNGYLGTHGERYNVPNQQYVEQGLFTIKKGVRNGNNGVLHTTITTKLTGKGQVYFINKFLKLKENGKLEACLQDIA
jgi:phage antirepressor YoqD-like protein